MFGLQLLPGVRDIRSALVSGYLWLFAGWILLVGKLPAAQHPTGILGNIHDLIHWAGPIATTAAVTLIAYVVGAILESLGKFNYFFRFWTFFLSDTGVNTHMSTSRIARHYNFSSIGLIRLELFVQQTLDDAIGRLAAHQQKPVEADLLAHGATNVEESLRSIGYSIELAIARDLPITAMRLVGDSDELFTRKLIQNSV